MLWAYGTMMDATETSLRLAVDLPPLERLSSFLVETGQCDARTIERGRRVGVETGQRLDRVLLQLGLVSERGLAEAFAAIFGLPLARPDDYPTHAPLLAERLPDRFLRSARAIPLAETDGELLVAVADPLDEFTPSAIAAAAGRPVTLAIAVPIELEAAFSRLYKAQEPEAEDGGDAEGEPTEEDAERLKDLASEAPVIRLVNQLIATAVETQASDIHIEPFEDRLRVRYRYDGLLHEADSPPARLAPAIVSRIKIMAKLDIAERRLPQDGRVKLAVRGHETDFRISTIPTLHGETVVLRVLDRSATVFDYAKLGLPQPVIARVTKALELPNGIVLVTGPTGSGKTTTLYTGLQSLNAASRKVVTVEDPVEYQLTGINQVQVKPQIGLTFARLLRSILRQDPDVIMVGEIRDLETAQIAVQAALTGHLVLSTLHTNSAAATITRLRDMGVEHYLLTAVLRGVLAQRLVRRLCMHCRREEPVLPEVVARFGLDRMTPRRPITLFQPVGCAHCRQTGYRGRLAIAEFLQPNEAIERLIFAGADHGEIERAAVASGMVPTIPGRARHRAGRADHHRGTGPQHPFGGLSDAGLPLQGDHVRRRGHHRAHGGAERGRGDRAASAQRQHSRPGRTGRGSGFRALGRAQPADRPAWRAVETGAGEPDPRTRDHADGRAGPGPRAALPSRNRAERAHATRGRHVARCGARRQPACDGDGPRGKSFSRLYLGMVRAGESGGQLAATLDRLALMLERQRSLAATVTSAMIYPCLLLLAAIGSIGLLLTDVLPQFVPLFEQNGVALPRPTRILIALGDAVSAYGLAGLLLLVLLGLLGRQALTRPGPRLWADRLLLRLPVVGGLLREVLAARFTRTLGTLVLNGVALITALGIVRDAIGNTAGVMAVERAISTARNGAGLAGLEGDSVFPLRTLHLLRLGQETAQLGEMALRAADIHEEECRIRVQRLVALLVPVITIALGLAVAGIVSSLLLAMLSLNNLAN